MRIKDIVGEAFVDIGKLPDEELKKGQALTGDGEHFKKVKGRIFHLVITKMSKFDALREYPKGLGDLTIYTVNEYNEMDCYIGVNNTSGFCVTKQGELVSVFSTAGSSGNAIVKEAIKRGARKLDCFAYRDTDGNIGGQLYKLYRRHGFEIDRNLNVGNEGEAYSIQNGVSSFVDENGIVHPEDERVVVFMIYN